MRFNDDSVCYGGTLIEFDPSGNFRVVLGSCVEGRTGPEVRGVLPPETAKQLANLEPGRWVWVEFREGEPVRLFV